MVAGRASGPVFFLVPHPPTPWDKCTEVPPHKKCTMREHSGTKDLWNVLLDVDSCLALPSELRTPDSGLRTDSGTTYFLGGPRRTINPRDPWGALLLGTRCRPSLSAAAGGGARRLDPSGSPGGRPCWPSLMCDAHLHPTSSGAGARRAAGGSRLPHPPCMSSTMRPGIAQPGECSCVVPVGALP